MAALAARKRQSRVWSVQHFRGIDSPLAPSVPPSPLLRWNGSKRGVVGHSGTPHSPYHARVTSEMGGAQMQRKHGAGDAGVSPHKGAMFESWFKGGDAQQQ